MSNTLSARKRCFNEIGMYYKTLKYTINYIVSPSDMENIVRSGLDSQAGKEKGMGRNCNSAIIFPLGVLLGTSSYT